MFPLILAGGAALAAVFLSGCHSHKDDCPQGHRLGSQEPTDPVQFISGTPNAEQTGKIQAFTRAAPDSSDLQDSQLRKILAPLFRNRDASLRSIDAMAATMKLPENAGKKFEIAVHTSGEGSSEMRRPLTQRRADALKSLYVFLGVPEERLTARGYGDACVLVPEVGDSEKVAKAQQANRRVEIFVK